MERGPMVVKFVPLSDELNTESAFLQAAMVLDISTEKALGREGEVSDRLSQVAALWLELGARMMGDEGGEEESHDHSDTKIKLGFVQDAQEAEYDGE